jgi:CHAD domain-containing protein
MREFVKDQIRRLLERLESEVGNAVRTGDEDAVHDLRVSIRRLNEALRTFSQLLPKRGVKKTRKRLKKVMRLAGEARNRDIAMALYAQAGVEENSSSRERLTAERLMARQQLLEALGRWGNHDFKARAASLLELEK